MNTIVDIQGFKDESNNMIVKEIAIMCDNRLQVYLIKPPHRFYNLTKSERRHVCWIERNINILWNEGYVPYSNYKSITRITEYLKDKTLFVKGYEKVIWAKKIAGHENVFNLEDRGCPSIYTLYDKYDNSPGIFSCIYHPNVCALKNVTILNKWCNENKKI